MPVQSNQEQLLASYLVPIAYQQVKIPSCIRTKSQQLPDDSSVASVQSILQGGYQDIKINISTDKEAWLQNDAPKACM